jgi:RNA-directed DNA polymerase
MARDLTRIGERARQEAKARFTSIYHYVTDVEHLRTCYEELPANRAAEIDGVGKEEYGRNLEAKLTELSAKLGRLGYRPQPVKRVYIPKSGTNKQRPLGILCSVRGRAAIADREHPAYSTTAVWGIRFWVN